MPLQPQSITQRRIFLAVSTSRIRGLACIFYFLQKTNAEPEFHANQGSPIALSGYRFPSADRILVTRGPKLPPQTALT